VCECASLPTAQIDTLTAGAASKRRKRRPQSFGLAFARTEVQRQHRVGVKCVCHCRRQWVKAGGGGQAVQWIAGT